MLRPPMFQIPQAEVVMEKNFWSCKISAGSASRFLQVQGRWRWLKSICIFCRTTFSIIERMETDSHWANVCKFYSALRNCPEDL